MRKNLILFLIYLTLLSGMMLGGCNKSTTVEEGPLTLINTGALSTDSNILSLADAQLFAEKITSKVFRGGSEDVTRGIASSFTIKDTNNKPALHVFNYENNGGYVVMSADYRFEPICAFVENGKINLNDTTPSMLEEWFHATVEIIESIRDGDMEDEIPGHQISWVRLGGAFNLERIPYPFELLSALYAEVDCNPYIDYTVDSLMDNQWGQDCGYNDLLPARVDGPCGKSRAGCVATAGAQLLHYWAKPHSVYNYATMPRDYGSSGVQLMMLDIGQIVNMDYGHPDGSSASPSELKDLFRYYHYYTSWGSYSDYQSNSTWVIKTDIDNGRPVILDGCGQKPTLFVWKHTKCHTWICDGYKLSTNSCRSGRFHLHMNWGWDGLYNGYYFQSNSWPATNSYQYTRSMLHNVYP